MFASGPGFNPRSSHTKDSKTVLDATLLNTQYYKVTIKVKWSNPGKGVAPSPDIGVVDIEKGAFRSPSTTVANFIFFTIQLNIYPEKLFITFWIWQKYIFIYVSDTCFLLYRSPLYVTLICICNMVLTLHCSSLVGWGCRIHRQHLCRGVRPSNEAGPVGWGCRMHQLYLCRRVRLLQWMSCIWHKTVWWWGTSNARALGNREYLFITIVHKFTQARSGSTNGVYWTVWHINWVQTNDLY